MKHQPHHTQHSILPPALSLETLFVFIHWVLKAGDLPVTPTLGCLALHTIGSQCGGNHDGDDGDDYAQGQGRGVNFIVGVDEAFFVLTWNLKVENILY